MNTAASAQELPKQYDHRQAQSRWYAFWEERGYFHGEPNPDRKPFSIVIPPPNVTGALHLGHALNNTLQDILARWRRMQGYEVLWMPGTDHAGIATQAIVEKRLREEENLTRHDLGREALVARIWKWKEQYEARILSQLKRMGCSCDWDRTRFTLDPICARAVRHTFFTLFRESLIYRGKRLVNWDTYLQTAVSDDEVSHEPVKGHFWHLSYPVIDPQPGEPSEVIVATTRPETMLGDTAVAVHPDPATALASVEAELRAKLAAAAAKDAPPIEAELERLAERRRDLLPQLVKLRDMARAGRQLMLPLANRPIPLVADGWAKPELGSGAVKITPAHDPNDYEVGLRGKLPMLNILNPDGTLNEAAGAYQGLNVKQARTRVVADLEAAGRLVNVEDREIDLAHSDRSKTPIEPYLVDQWFVKMDRLAQTAMDAVIDGRVKIIPERYAKGYLDWLGEKRDWPVGRQLWWGHRIPIWSQTVATDSAADALVRSIESLRQRPEFAPLIEFKRIADSETSGGGELQVCILDDAPGLVDQIEALGFVQTDDVLDTWFSSALWPHSTLGWPEKTPELAYFYPTSTLITSRDIITLWVARMVLAGLHNTGQVPFRDVYIHPKILDGFGEGMSKTKGNGVDPLDVIDKFGADALRFGLAYLTTETQDVRMPVDFECPHCHELVEQTKKNRVLPVVECPKCGQSFSTQWAREDTPHPRAAVVSERFELARNFSNKLWNASRFALLNLEGYEPGPVADDELTIEDRWVLSRLSTVTAGVTDALGDYRYADAMRLLYDFAWDDFCSFYVEMVKGRLQDPAARVVAQRVLAHTLDVLLRLLHPVVPFVTEEVWQLLGQFAPRRGLGVSIAPAESVMIAPWPQADLARQDAQIEAQFKQFQAVLGGLREIRSRQNIGPKIPIQFTLRADAAICKLLEPMRPYFQALTNATGGDWGPAVTPPATNASFTLAGIEVYVDMQEFIDVPAEIARLEKERERLLSSATSKEKKLENASFIERAPADVVNKEREDLARIRQQIDSITASLAALKRQA